MNGFILKTYCRIETKEINSTKKADAIFISSEKGPEFALLDVMRYKTKGMKSQKKPKKLNFSANTEKIRSRKRNSGAVSEIEKNSSLFS